MAFNQRLDALQVQLSGSAQTHQKALEEIKSLMIDHNNQANVAISRATSAATFIQATGLYIPPPDKKNG